MSNEVKVSLITAQDIADYIRLDDYDEEEIKKYLEIAKSFIKNYTGQKDLDKFPDFVIVVYALCQDMYDNRSLYIEKTNLNKMVECILGMHSVNLL